MRSSVLSIIKMEAIRRARELLQHPFVGEFTVLELLPTELWDIILQKLDSPMDLLNCCRANSTWNVLSEEHKSTMYFHLALPNILPYLRRRDLLRCCQVSRSWAAIVDACVEQVNETDENASRQRGHWVYVEMRHFQRGADYIDSFLDAINCNSTIAPINLIMFRNFYMPFHLLSTSEEADRESQANFFSKVHKFLGKHGKYVRRLHLQILWQEPWPQICGSTMHIISSCLRRTPNLRKLVTEVCTNRVEQQINQNVFLQLYPLPDLPDLKSFVCYSKIMQISSILLNRYGNQLELLDCQRYGAMGAPASCDAEMSSLKNLSAQIILPTCVENFEAFTQTHRMTLKKLMLTLDCELRYVTVQSLIGIVNQFHSGVEEFTLKCRCRPAWTHALSSPARFHENNLTLVFSRCRDLRLPAVKSLTLSRVGFPTADMLNHVTPSVEKLVVEYSGSERFALENKMVEMYENLYADHYFWNKLTNIKEVFVTLVLSREEGPKIKKSYSYTKAMYLYLLHESGY